MFRTLSARTPSLCRLQSTAAYTELLSAFKTDLKAAMIAKDGPRKMAIRNIMAVVKNKELEKMGKANTEFAAFDILSKIASERSESMEQYGAAGRADLVEGERYELEVVKLYLDTLPVSSKEEIEVRVRALAAEAEGAGKIQMKDLMLKVDWKTVEQDWKASAATVKAVMAQVVRSS